MKLVIPDFIGWTGAILYLIAYWLISTERVRGSSKLYQWINLVAGACTVLHTLAHGAVPSATLNLVWAGIAAFTILRAKKV